MKLLPNGSITINRYFWYIRHQWAQLSAVTVMVVFLTIALSRPQTDQPVIETIEFSLPKRDQLVQSLNLSKGIAELDFDSLVGQFEESAEQSAAEIDESTELRVSTRNSAEIIRVEFAMKQPLTAQVRRAIASQIDQEWTRVVESEVSSTERALLLQKNVRVSYLKDGLSETTFIGESGQTKRLIGDTGLLATQELWSTQEKIGHNRIFATAILQRTSSSWSEYQNLDRGLTARSLAGAISISVLAMLIWAFYLATRRWSPDYMTQLTNLGVNHLGVLDLSAKRVRWSPARAARIIAQEIKTESFVLTPCTNRTNIEQVANDLRSELEIQSDMQACPSPVDSDEILRFKPNTPVVLVISVRSDCATEIGDAVDTLHELGFSQVSALVLR